MLTIQIPPNFQPERRYIISVLLGEFLGLELQIEVAEIDRISICNNDEKKLTFSDHLFAVDLAQWLQLDSLPLQPLKVWDLSNICIEATTVNSLIPVIYGKDPDAYDFFVRSENAIDLGLDIFGSSFFMLTRYEEVVKAVRDRLDRFPASASLAYQEQFLDRPIVNEYLEILWGCLKLLWPGLQRKQHHFQILVSHDLDEPFLYAGTGIPRLLQRCAGDLVRRGSMIEMGRTLKQWYQVAKGHPELDPYNTFGLIMDISETNNLKSAFYFIADRTAGSIDGFYSLRHPLIRELLRKVYDRGHEIGLHTSYHTYQDQNQTKKEFEVLRRACEEEGIEQDQWGGRQHYLRWHAPTTFQNWEYARLDYDSTLGYPEQLGFRCGTCYQYSVFNLLNKEHLQLKERPLLIMDVSVIRKTYMGLDINNGSALSVMKKIKKRCKLFEGVFTLLWHNTGFLYHNEIELYRQILLS